MSKLKNFLLKFKADSYYTITGMRSVLDLLMKRWYQWWDISHV